MAHEDLYLGKQCEFIFGNSKFSNSKRKRNFCEELNFINTFPSSSSGKCVYVYNKIANSVEMGITRKKLRIWTRLSYFYLSDLISD